MEFVRQGDALVVTKLDRLARSVPHLWSIVQSLETKGASLRVLQLGMDTATSTGRLMLTVLGGVAQFEREMMLERQREGIAKAKGQGRYKGRKPTARSKAEQIRTLASEGATKAAIATELGVSERSVFRVLSDIGTKQGMAVPAGRA